MGNFTEADVKTKYMLPAIKNAGWDIQTQVREEVSCTQGLIVASVEELMALCDQLKVHIVRTQTLNNYLMDSFIHSMTEAA